MTIISLSLEEVHVRYSNRHGFIFRGIAPSSDESAVKLAHLLVSTEVSMDFPEFIVRVDANTICFVYPEGEFFDSAGFYLYCHHHRNPRWQVNTLNGFFNPKKPIQISLEEFQKG